MTLPALRQSALLVLPAVLCGLLPPAAVADDWPQWRGPDRDARSQETGLLDKWPADGPPLAWKIEGVGAGFSSLAVADGRLLTLGDLDDGCYLLARKESDGTPLWKTRVGEAGGHSGYPGPRSTPTIDDGEVFAIDQHGGLTCLKAEDGEKIWSVNLQQDFGGKMMSGWRWSESPLVDDDMVICTPGGSDGTLLALDRKTGKEVWRTTDWTDSAGYSSVVIATIRGVRQYVQLTGESVAGVDPDSGKVLWKADRPGKTAVITTPVVGDNIVFVTSSYGVGCHAFLIEREGDDWSAEQIYSSLKFANHHGGVILHEDHVYGSSGANYACMNLKSGELMYRERSAGKGATVYADGHFYLRSEDGPVALIEASSNELTEVSRFEQPHRSGKKAWPHPVIANGKLYLRDQGLLLCYDIAKK